MNAPAGLISIPVTEHGNAEQSSGAEQLSDKGENDDCNSIYHTHSESVNSGGENRVSRRISLGTGKNNTVNDYKRYKQTKGFADSGSECFKKHFYHSNKTGYYNYV